MEVRQVAAERRSFLLSFFINSSYPASHAICLNVFSLTIRLESVIENLSCLRFLWHNLKELKSPQWDLEEWSSISVSPTFKRAKEFVTNFETVYENEIATAWDTLAPVQREEHDEAYALQLASHCSFAWQPLLETNQDASSLARIVSPYEQVGDAFSALVIQETLATQRIANGGQNDVEEVGHDLKNMYERSFRRLLVIASRLGLDNRTCGLVSPIIHRVVRLKNLSLLEYFMRCGEDITTVDFLDRTVGHIAAEVGAVETMKAMPESVCHAGSGSFGKSPLFLAARFNQLDVMKYLIFSAQAGSTTTDSPADTLKVAAAHGNLKAVQILLLSDIHFDASAKTDALRSAALGGHCDIVRLFSIARVDVNDDDYPNVTLLGAVSKKGYLHMIQLLLQKGARVNGAKWNGRSPLVEAVASGQVEACRLLLQAGARVNCQVKIPGCFDFECQHTCVLIDVTPLTIASARGNVNLIHLFLHAGAGVEEDNKTCDLAALKFAAGRGHQEVVNLFLGKKHFCEAFEKDNESTALIFAVSAEHTTIVRRLLEAKAKVDPVTKRRSIHHGVNAWSHPLIETCTLPKRQSIATFPGATALQVAAHRGSLEITQMLINRNAAVNFVKNDNFELWENSRYNDESLICFDTPLQLAARSGNLSVVQLLLSSGATIRGSRWLQRPTALQNATRQGHSHVAKLLCEFLLEESPSELIAEINAPSAEPGGLTALAGASESGCTETLRFLLSLGAEVNSIPSKNGGTALLKAVKGEDLEIAEILLEANADVNFWPQPSQPSPLQAAAAIGNCSIAAVLLRAGADLNALPAASEEGITALQGAAASGNLDIVQMLLRRNAIINAENAFSTTARTALQSAVCESHADIVNCLLAAGADPNSAAPANVGKTALQIASLNGRPDIVRDLLMAGASVNDENSSWAATALHAAVESQSLESCRALLGKGACVDTYSKIPPYETALQWAVTSRNVEIVRELLRMGANVNLSSANSDPPLLKATTVQSLDIVDILLESGADVDQENRGSKKSTALEMAIQLGADAITYRLLRSGANVNVGFPLSIAAKRNNLELVRILLGKGADVHIESPPPSDRRFSIQSPLFHAIMTGNKELIRLFSQLSTSSSDVEGALCLAVLNDNITAVRLLIKSGADPNTMLDSRQSPLRSVAYPEIGEIISKILKTLKAGPSPDLACDSISALQIAVYLGHNEIVGLLLLAGTDIHTAPGAHTLPVNLWQSAQLRRDSETVQLVEIAGVRRSWSDLMWA
ncbi:MAG: hypothetical protein M1837_005969 [Sclerophora amabilis]|nr:MAG: hypothetical protein M1837_005969 [Sclerophora amabilis]